MTRAAASRPSSLVVSILAGLPQRHAASLEARRGLEQTAAWLSRQLDTVGFTSTWFSADPAAAAKHELAQVVEKHSLGLLTEAAWTSPKTSRAKLAAELSRRLVAARMTGLQISSLALPGVDVPHADLIHRHDIQAVASFSASESRGLGATMRSPFFGLWQTPIEIMLPHSGLRRLRMAARSWLSAGAGKGGIMHAGIDLSQLWQGGAVSQRSLRRWLTTASRFCDGERYQMVSLETAIASLAPKRQAPSRSILKVA